MANILPIHSGIGDHHPLPLLANCPLASFPLPSGAGSPTAFFALRSFYIQQVTPYDQRAYADLCPAACGFFPW
jgi:hypothetical protein